jgi:hypothetical protein
MKIKNNNGNTGYFSNYFENMKYSVHKLANDLDIGTYHINDSGGLYISFDSHEMYVPDEIYPCDNSKYEVDRFTGFSVDLSIFTPAHHCDIYENNLLIDFQDNIYEVFFHDIFGQWYTLKNFRELIPLYKVIPNIYEIIGRRLSYECLISTVQNKLLKCLNLTI